MNPALIQGSSPGTVPLRLGPFRCSGYDCNNCVKPGYIRAGWWPPRAVSGYMDPGCIPMRPPWCRAVNPGWVWKFGEERRALDRTPAGVGPGTVWFERGEGVSEPRVDTGLSPGLLLKHSPGDASPPSALCCASCANSASMQKFLAFSREEVILSAENLGFLLELWVKTAQWCHFSSASPSSFRLTYCTPAGRGNTSFYDSWQKSSEGQ